MPDYRYVAWFRDHTLDPDEQDAEWVACFIIAAQDAAEALGWGDHLASDYGRRMSHEFLRSYLDPDRWEDGQVPRIRSGEDATDELIGW